MRLTGIDDPDLPLSEVMRRWPQTIEVFLRHRMLCVGCMINPFHTIMDACLEYDLDAEVFLAELKSAIRGDAQL